MPVLSRWDRKSVSQLVQHYQSCSDLRSTEIYNKAEEAELEGSRRRGDDVDLFRVGHSLSRSRSMEVLPQGGRSITKSLCALFESKSFMENSSSFQHIPPSGGALLEWKNYKKQNSQRNVEMLDGASMNGQRESHNRESECLKGDKNRVSVTKGSPIQGRNRIPTSSSVRDRSTLYLSLTADATGGFEQPETTCSAQGKKAKGKKFQLSAREMCSACLTPVYPMEKMVANKLILHRNCFCCKYCEKKLGIHNYSSLYGEFYCVSHYQQLFKRKGNYDEGFGHKQHKDRWIQKQADEPDAMTTPKATKNKMYFLSGSRESVSTTMAPAKELTNRSNQNSGGKLKISWPPDKKSQSNQVKYPQFEKKVTLQFDKPITPTITKNKHNDHKKVKISFMKMTDVPDSGKKPADVKGQSKKASGQLSSAPPKSVRLLKESQYTYGKNTENSQTQPENNITKQSDPSCLTVSQSKSSKVKKMVHFAPEVDTPVDQSVSQFDQCQITNEEAERSEVVSFQTERDIVSPSTTISTEAPLPIFESTAFEETPADVVNLNDKTSETSPIFPGFTKNDEVKIYKDIDMNPTDTQTLSQVDSITDAPTENEEILKMKTGNTAGESNQVEMITSIVKTDISTNLKGVLEAPNQEDETEGSLEMSKLNIVKEHGAEDKSVIGEAGRKRSIDSNSSHDAHVLTQNTSIITNDSGEGEDKIAIFNNDERKLDNSMMNSAEANAAAIVSQTENKTEEASIINEKGQAENPKSDNLPKKAVSRTNSKPKVGSGSKSVSPLSKLFTSGANNKTAKADAKDTKRTEIKPGGGLLGRLFQSSVTEKSMKAEKSVEQNVQGDTGATDQNKKVVQENSGLDVVETNPTSEKLHFDHNESPEADQLSPSAINDSRSLEVTTEGAQDGLFSGDSSGCSLGDVLGAVPNAESSKSNTEEIAEQEETEQEQALLEHHDSTCPLIQTHDMFGDISAISTLNNTAWPTVDVQSTQAEINLSSFDDPYITDHTLVNPKQAESETSDSLSVTRHNVNSDFNLDIFAPNDMFFSQPPTVTEAASAPQQLDFLYDIFGSGDFPNTDTDHKESSTDAVPVTLGIFASDTELLPLSQSKNEVSLLEGFSLPDNLKDQETEKTTSTDISWMDNLLD